MAKRSTSGASSSSSRLPPVKASDFTAQELQESVFLNCVGTFGVTSAGYWWGRAAGAIVRLTHYALSQEAALWALIYSDDGILASGDEWKERRLLLHLLVLAVLEVPLAWHKV